MRNLLIILTIITLISPSAQCQQNNDNFLDALPPKDTLYLVHQGKECGEWGGNKEIIRIYIKQLKAFEQDLYADYLTITKNCDDPDNPSKQTKSIIKQHVKLTIEDQQLAYESIQELLYAKIYKNKKELFHGNAGIFNKIYLSDSSFVLKDYPSISWSKFQLLKDHLVQQK